MRKIFFMALAAIVTFASCSKQEDDPGKSGAGTGDKAFLSLNLFGTASGGTRAAGDPTSGTGQDKVNDVTILYFDKDNRFLDKSKKMLPSEFTTSGNKHQTTNAIEVPGATAKVFVVVNNYEANGTTPRFTLPSIPDDARKEWKDLNQTLTDLDVNTTVDSLIQKVSGTLADKTTDNYTMANFGMRYDGSNLNPNDNGLVPVTTGKDATEAKAHSNEIFVDRLASKVEFGIKEKTANTNEVEATPTGAKFFFEAWELNVTNRYLRLYAEHDVNYTGVDANGVKVAYRKDANYTQSSYGTITNWTDYKKQFVYLRNINESGATSTDKVERIKSAIAYCPENTMDAPAQLVGATTKVTVKGNYVPNTFNADDSYFTYAGTYYTLASLKTAYATNTPAGIQTDVNKFMTAAGITKAVADLTETDFDEETGIKARTDNAVRYFHKGVSYYNVLIRHDQRIDTFMALARYGTVRNNWYKLTLNSVSQEGTPWIPGGPDDPDTKPETPDDKTVFLDVTISINPWVIWSQGVDL